MKNTSSTKNTKVSGAGNTNPVTMPNRGGYSTNTGSGNKKVPRGAGGGTK